MTVFILAAVPLAIPISVAKYMEYRDQKRLAYNQKHGIKEEYPRLQRPTKDVAQPGGYSPTSWFGNWRNPNPTSNMIAKRATQTMTHDAIATATNKNTDL